MTDAKNQLQLAAFSNLLISINICTSLDKLILDHSLFTSSCFQELLSNVQNLNLQFLSLRCCGLSSKIISKITQLASKADSKSLLIDLSNNDRFSSGELIKSLEVPPFRIALDDVMFKKREGSLSFSESRILINKYWKVESFLMAIWRIFCSSPIFDREVIRQIMLISGFPSDGFEYEILNMSIPLMTR
jgi:hypothetical protein